MNDESTPDDTAPGDGDHADTTTDDPIPQDPTEEFPPPPHGDPTAPRRLRRSNDDRMVAGVSGGIAEYFGIDPIIVRLAFVALVLLGGSGIGIYLIAWLVMPEQHEYESAAMNALRGGGRPGGRSLLAIGLLVLGIIIFSGSLFWNPIGEGLFLPLLILAAGIALLVWPSDGVRWNGWPGSDEEWQAERQAMRQEWRREREAWRESRRNWRHGYQRGMGAEVRFQGRNVDFEASSGSPLPPPPPRPPVPPMPPRPRRHRPRPFLGPLTIAALLLYAGLTVLAEQADWWSTDPASFLAVCLMIIGGVLTVSAFLGRARGLIWLGVLLLPIAWALAAVDLTWWDGIGEEQVTVSSLAELEGEYRWGMGEFHVDLSDLDLDGETRELDVGLTIGELKIWVPSTIGVEIDLDGSLGSVIVNDSDLRLNDDGFEVELDRTVGDPTGGTLLLDADIGIGEAEVIVCGAGAIPCP